MSEENLVGMLREITEEGDLNSILKSSIGGYTKKSVMDYLAAVKKQQQSLKDSYSAEIDRLQTEKETLRSSLAEAEERELNASAEHQKRMEAQKAELESDFEDQYRRMQSEREELQNDLDETRERVGELAATIRQYERQLQDAQQTAEAHKQDVSTNQILLDTANHKVEELSRLLAAKDDENRFLKETEQQLRAALEEDVTSEFSARIQELLEKNEVLQGEVALRDQELANRETRLATLEQQEKSQHEVLEAQQLQLQKLLDQNAWLTGENNDLGERLKEQMQQSITNTRDYSRLKAANAIMQRKLDLLMTHQQTDEIASNEEE